MGRFAGSRPEGRQGVLGQASLAQAWLSDVCYPNAFAITNAADAARPPTITVWRTLRTGLPVVNKPLMKPKTSRAKSVTSTDTSRAVLTEPKKKYGGPPPGGEQPPELRSRLRPALPPRPPGARTLRPLSRTLAGSQSRRRCCRGEEPAVSRARFGLATGSWIGLSTP